jgi:hypothetical protein
MRRLIPALAALSLLLMLSPLALGADLTITAASVARGTGATTTVGTAGATLTAGQAVYQSTADNKMYPSLASGTALQATFAGVALHASLAGQPIAYQTGGNITIGATVVVGTIYVVSTNAGGIAPWADLIATNNVTVIGYGLNATTITYSPIITGVVHP